MQKIIDSTTQMDALKQIGFLWIHEISHILREHNQRAAEGAVDPNLWNIAADMEINDSHWEGLEAPELYPGIYPHTFKMNPGELAETYYRKLTEKSERELKKGLAKTMDKILAEEKKDQDEKKKEQDQQDENSDPQQDTDDPSEGENGTDDPNSDQPENSENGTEDNPQKDSSDQKGDHPDNPENNTGEQGDHPDAEEENENAGGPGIEEGDQNADSPNDENNSGETTNSEESQNGKEPEIAPKEDPHASYHELLDEGSGVHNTPRPWELAADNTESQELDEIETEQIRVAVAQEMSEAQKAGLLPAGWERWVGKKLRPTVDWKKVLRHRVSRAINHSIGARIDYSFARPSRRQAVYQPLIPPALAGNLTGQIACVVDTSGSIDDLQLTKILSEVCGILEVFNTPVTIIPCDAKAYPSILLTRSTDLRQITSMPGGGGTNMIRGIEAALELQPAPDVVVVLTDGYTPYPEKLYKTPVLFGIITNDLERTNMLPGSPWRDDLVVKILIE